jgi:glycosyltransferase involved in cell wall biosynthesis
MELKMLDLTIAIPVRNEEKNLPGCLEAIGRDFAQKIVIIDSGSTDQTKEISKTYGAELINFSWDGKFPKKRNWYLRNHTPTTKWILFIDADEYLTENFKHELSKEIIVDNKVGYWLNYTIYFMGKKLKGGYPLKKLALFRTGSCEYEQINEEQWSNLDMEVHEHPMLEGDVGRIKSKIDHQDFRGVTHYINKHAEYAAWEAKRFLQTISDQSITSKWTWKQRIKYKLVCSVWIGPIYFLGSFVFLGGFKDGTRGLAFAILKMSYFNRFIVKYANKKTNDFIG